MSTRDTTHRSLSPKVRKTIERLLTLDELREKMADDPAGRRWAKKRRSTALFRFYCAFADQERRTVACRDADALLAAYRREVLR